MARLTPLEANTAVKTTLGMKNNFYVNGRMPCPPPSMYAFSTYLDTHGLGSYALAS